MLNILQAANTLQLFAFIQRDLSIFKPRPETVAHGDHEDTSSFDPIAEPHFPKSLYLIRPLFNSHELNPVASAAQKSVPVPEGLDLDAWIVPSQQRRQEEVEDAAAKVKKNKKGKGKETNGTKSGKSGKRRQREENSPDRYPPVETEVETAEERAERERVSCRASTYLQLTHSAAAQGRTIRAYEGRSVLYYGRQHAETTNSS